MWKYVWHIEGFMCDAEGFGIGADRQLMKILLGNSAVLYFGNCRILSVGR